MAQKRAEILADPECPEHNYEQRLLEFLLDRSWDDQNEIRKKKEAVDIALEALKGLEERMFEYSQAAVGNSKAAVQNGYPHIPPRLPPSRWTTWNGKAVIRQEAAPASTRIMTAFPFLVDPMSRNIERTYQVVQRDGGNRGGMCGYPFWTAALELPTNLTTSGVSHKVLMTVTRCQASQATVKCLVRENASTIQELAGEAVLPFAVRFHPRFGLRAVSAIDSAISAGNERKLAAKLALQYIRQLRVMRD
ncbi:hypothetical protein C8J56DRAFT_888275 [Mycena floridula]|nr:hypothetical protein C8J56DRAFT_888275 [Mycena floridula]